MPARLWCVSVSLLVGVLLGPAAVERVHSQSATGVLLLAHGGSESWNDNVRSIREAVNRTFPTEVAFGMATRSEIQAAIDRLHRRGIVRIVAVPLFVSSHSSVMTSTEYLLGLRKDMPADLAIFAAIAHGTGGGGGEHHGADSNGTKPVTLPVPVVMAPALDAHPIVASIVSSRAQSISREPGKEAVVLVAHGPQSDDENRQWLVNLQKIAMDVRRLGFVSVDALTVRDDAPAVVRESATAELRALVTERKKAGFRVLVVPVLLSFGGIEKGIQKRLEGLDYVMSEGGLAPDDRLVDWVVEMVRVQHKVVAPSPRLRR